MTAKEKAIELVHTMFGWTFDDRDDPNTPNLAAYKCALIAVDEIIIELEYHQRHPETKDMMIKIRISQAFQYWKAVKQEIEKL